MFDPYVKLISFFQFLLSLRVTPRYVLSDTVVIGFLRRSSLLHETFLVVMKEEALRITKIWKYARRK